MRCKKCKCDECSKPHEPQAPAWVTYSIIVIFTQLFFLPIWVDIAVNKNKIDINKNRQEIKNNKILLDNGDM